MIKIIKKKRFIAVVENFGILYRASKWPVLYDKFIGKSKVVCSIKGIRVMLLNVPSLFLKS